MDEYGKDALFFKQGHTLLLFMHFDNLSNFFISTETPSQDFLHCKTKSYVAYGAYGCLCS